MTQLPKYFFGENYVKPDEPEPVVLTPAKRQILKDRMKLYFNAQGSVEPREFLDFAEDWLIKNHGLHIGTDVLIDVAIEIQTEWNWIEVPE